MKVHVYKIRKDDLREREDLHFCTHCKGWYGIPHYGLHCQEDRPSQYPVTCACRFCKQKIGVPITGEFGFFTTAKEWQP